MKKIITGIAIYGAVFGVMWKFFIYPLCRVSQREDEWMKQQSQKRKQ
ncbi:MAG: hypothetical protein LIO65_06155 [Odoribacter sp.]|nr:hypothetical protein [Odoribacter sp.]